MEEIARRYVELSEDWVEQLECLFSQISRHFGRIERQRHAWEYLLGLLGAAERKNGWQLAEAAEHITPFCLQPLFDRARWDADAVRDDLTDIIAEELGDPHGVLMVDETEFLKKGSHSVGVQRQYSGTVGRIENCQIGRHAGVLRVLCPSSYGLANDGARGRHAVDGGRMFRGSQGASRARSV
jgi:SRSO17 transposase